MAYVEQGDPDLLVFRSGGGLLALFGLPFLPAGSFVIALTLGLVSTEGDVPPLAVGLPFGGVFAAVGAGVVFGRAGATIDRRRQSLVKWWGMLGFARRSEYPLPDFCEVTLRKEIRKGKNSSYAVYPVGLRSETRQQTVALEESRDYGAARGLAERVAKLVDKPLADSSSGAVVVRRPGSLDLSIRDAARASGERIEVPAAPPQMRSNVTIDGTRVSIEIPSTGVQGAHKLVMGVLCAFLLLEVPFLFPLFAGEDSFGGAGLPLFFVFGAMAFVVPVIALGRLVLASSHRRVFVQASSDGLRVEEREPLRSRVTEIPGYELEEIGCSDVGAQVARARGAGGTASIQGGASGVQQAEISPMLGSLLHIFGRGGNITARSDRASVSFGNGLPNAEAEYLVAVIKQALVG